MDGKQLSLWDKDYLNKVAPRLKTVSEIKKEKRDLFNRSLVVKQPLSSLEEEIYSIPLRKEDLVEFFNEKEWEVASNYYMNKGVPQMLLTTLSKYCEKDQKDLLVSDMKILHKTLENIFPGDIGNLETKKFSKANHLFFGGSQYSFMGEYLKNFD